MFHRKLGAKIRDYTFKQADPRTGELQEENLCRVKREELLDRIHDTEHSYKEKINEKQLSANKKLLSNNSKTGKVAEIEKKAKKQKYRAGNLDELVGDLNGLLEQLFA